MTYKETTMRSASRITSILFAILALTGGTTTALAHDDATMGALKSAHGGQLRMAGIYHYELVVSKDTQAAKDSPVQVYVTDHAGLKISSAGATGTATILAGKQKSSVALKPDGDNRLIGLAKYTSTPDMKVLVSITLPGKQPEQARFEPLATAKEGRSDHAQ